MSGEGLPSQKSDLDVLRASKWFTYVFQLYADLILYQIQTVEV